ncbi:acyltransferase domain-containing protein [Streptomyces sp. G45]|uniref:acyltransferase domain-containing protein n=1 Tax=Streptomyces sp. G45 TaxID=3406627 RepID=UPI003C1D853A
MGRELAEAFPVFAAALDEAAEHLDPLLDRPLRDVMHAADGTLTAALLERTAFTQPCLFAYQVALFRLLTHWGLTPGLLLGHSIGELAAAHVSGVLSLQDACALVAARGRLMEEVPDAGAMVAVRATEAEVLPQVAAYADEVAVAAVNGPESVVLSGTESAVLEIAAHWRDQGRKTRRLRVSHAFHSPHMTPVLDAFGDVARKLTFHPPRIPIVSDVTGDIATADELCSPEYWVRHAQATVRFHDGVRRLVAEGARTLLEVGPSGTLTALAQDCLADAPRGRGTAVIPVARSARPEADTARVAVSEAFVHGAGVDWPAFFTGTGARRVDLPTYAFQRRRFPWSATTAEADVGAVGLARLQHPLLGAALHLADAQGLALTGTLTRRTQPWLADHVMLGTALVPGTAVVELALRAGAEAGCRRLADLTQEAPLVLPDRGAVHLQVRVALPGDDGHRAVGVYSRPEDAAADEPWTCHARGTLAPDTAAAPPAPGAAWPPPGAEPLPLDRFYPRLAAAGFAYGPAFQGLTRAWRHGDEVYAEVTLPEAARSGGHDLHPARLHPAQLDAALHAALLAGDGPDIGASRVRIPFAWRDVSLHGPGAPSLRVRIAPAGTDAVSVALWDAHHTPVASVGSLVTRPVSARHLRAARTHETLFHVDWTPAAPAPAAAAARRAVLGDRDTADLLAAHAYADLGALQAAVDAGGPVPDLVLLPCRGGPSGTAGRAPRAP